MYVGARRSMTAVLLQLVIDTPTVEGGNSQRMCYEVEDICSLRKAHPWGSWRERSTGVDG